MNKPRKPGLLFWATVVLIGLPLLCVAIRTNRIKPGVGDGLRVDERQPLQIRQSRQAEERLSATSIHSPGKQPDSDWIVSDWIAIGPHWQPAQEPIVVQERQELKPPSLDEVLKVLPEKLQKELPTRGNLRVATDRVVDSLTECRFYPQVGPAQYQRISFKCTVTCDMDLSVEEIVYIDHRFMVRCPSRSSAERSEPKNTRGASTDP